MPMLKNSSSASVCGTDKTICLSVETIHRDRIAQKFIGFREKCLTMLFDFFFFETLYRKYEIYIFFTFVPHLGIKKVKVSRDRPRWP